MLEIISFNLQACFTFNLHCMSNFCWWNLFYQAVVSVKIIIVHCTISYCSQWCKWIRLVKYTVLFLIFFWLCIFEQFWLVTNLMHNFSYNMFTWILYMFQAILCSSSRGQLY